MLPNNHIKNYKLNSAMQNSVLNYTDHFNIYIYEHMHKELSTIIS